ncbi:hypothetical protein AL01_09475 [Bombella intestini]|uniref:Uncharacterized protein n=1 Tax=Bombella intestini TaxID=1539051 RepID=A0A1S8GMP7_9PROT|nr:hypothetical protein AL01_09475 [Bombella intestini]
MEMKWEQLRKNTINQKITITLLLFHHLFLLNVMRRVRAHLFLKRFILLQFLFLIVADMHNFSLLHE